MVKEECKMSKPKLSIATWGKYSVVEAGIWCKNTDDKISRKRIIWGKALLRNTPLTTAPGEPRQSAHGGWQLQVSVLRYPVQKLAANSLTQVVLLIRGISFYLLLPPLPLSSYHLQFCNASSNHSNRFCRNSVSWSPLTAFSSWKQHRYAPAFCQLLTEPVAEEQSSLWATGQKPSSCHSCPAHSTRPAALGPRWGRQAALRQLSNPPPQPGEQGTGPVSDRPAALAAGSPTDQPEHSTLPTLPLPRGAPAPRQRANWERQLPSGRRRRAPCPSPTTPPWRARTPGPRLRHSGGGCPLPPQRLPGRRRTRLAPLPRPAPSPLP